MGTVEHDRIGRLLSEYDRDESKYGRLCYYVEGLLRKLIESSGIRVSSVTSRLKERGSFAKKIGRCKYQSAGDVTDLAGVRVVTYFEDDVDKVASIIKNCFEVDVLNSVNKRRTLPVDQFGYRSSHLVVSLTPQRANLPENHEFASSKIEIQVRSLLQHAWAEIEHGYYKEAGLPSPIARRLSRVAGLLEIADQEFASCRQEAIAPHTLPICRYEGVAELVEDFQINIPFSALPRDFSVDRPLLLYFNTHVTNRILANGQTEVQLYVEQGSARVESARGSLVANGVLSFSGIFPMLPRPKQDYIRLCISGLRINAHVLGLGPALTGTTVQCSVAIGERSEADEQGGAREPSVPLVGPIDIARIAKSFSFEPVAIDPPTPQLPVRLSPSEHSQEVVIAAVYRPLFAQVFRSRDGENGTDAVSAKQGTCISLSLLGVPRGAELFVSTSELAESPDRTSFRLVEVGQLSIGRVGQDVVHRPIDSRDASFEQLQTLGTRARAVWECVHSLGEDQVPSFGLWVRVGPQCEPFTLTASGALAPLRVTHVASQAGSIPGFSGLSEQPTIAIVELVV
ncbi:MAG TPA: RelA/SpoT domain-containing protein [Bryobacteraceae bacterium]|nr:RelA/SpoT domain-containing protein [Bryobacteraceae bacterium]